MQVIKVKNRGLLFVFHDIGSPTNVYAICGKKQIYLIDTYLGPESMELVQAEIEARFGKKPIVVINTHSHWDHVWGNSFFSSSWIIAHEKCKEFMVRDGKEELKRNAHYQKGEVQIHYPNLTFTGDIFFEEDGVLVFHSPGHSEDGISLLDMEDKVLFAGDNLERPIPYFFSKDLEQYRATLEHYLRLDAQVILGGHTDCETKELIHHNLDYVKKVISGDPIEMESSEFERYHKKNLEWLHR